MTQDSTPDLTETKQAMDRAKDALDRLADRPEAHGHLSEVARRLRTSIEYELVELEKIAEMLGL